MTAAERLQAEKERLLTTTGFYVPPYRMANLMKAAAKIMDNPSNICNQTHFSKSFLPFNFFHARNHVSKFFNYPGSVHPPFLQVSPGEVRLFGG